MSNNEHLFNHGGFAALSDLQSEDWRLLYGRLEHEQSRFLAAEGKFRSPEYKWPRDPLHTWSRVWEYPYVFFHLEKIRHEFPENKLLKVADIGSGVTFFPFSVARLGYDVTCIDIDPICARDIPSASKVIDCSPGHVGADLIADGRIPLPDASQDVVYCISVLEHVPNPATTLSEIYRILKPGGAFIITVDIDLRGNSELGINAFNELLDKADDMFCKLLTNRSIHPSDYLNTANSPYHIKDNSLVRISKRVVALMLGKYDFIGDLRVGVFLTVHASVYHKAKLSD